MPEKFGYKPETLLAKEDLETVQKIASEMEEYLESPSHKDLVATSKRMIPDYDCNGDLFKSKIKRLFDKNKISDSKRGVYCQEVGKILNARKKEKKIVKQYGKDLPLFSEEI